MNFSSKYASSCQTALSRSNRSSLTAGCKKLVTGSLLASLSTFFVLASAEAQEISPLLVGTNFWYADPVTGAGPSGEVWQQTEDLGMQTIRIGGAHYDYNMPSNQTMMDWVDQIKSVGAEPIIQVSQYDATTGFNDAAAAAADLVKYINIDNNRNVTIWNIGNEPWLQNDFEDFNGMAEYIEGYTKRIAKAMKEIDPTIKIYGPDLSDLYGEIYDELFGGNNDISGKIPGTDVYYVDGLSWHRYPWGVNFDDNPEPSIEGAADLYERAKTAKEIVDRVNKLHSRNGDEAMEWGVGEFNSKRGELVHTFANGQMFGQLYGYAMKYEATYATTWSMYENGGSRTGTDFSMIDGNGTPRATYRHMEFVAKYMKGEYADGETTESDVVAYGSHNNQQHVAIIMNRGEDDFKYTLRFDDNAIDTDDLAINIDANEDLQYSDSIAAYTTQVLVFKGDELIVINYSKNDFDNNRAPSEDELELCGNKRPTIDAPDAIFFEVGDRAQTLKLTGISDGDDCDQGVIVSASSADSDVIKVGEVEYESCDADAELVITPKDKGMTTVEVEVKDNGSDICDSLSKTVSLSVQVAERKTLPGMIEAETFTSMKGIMIETNEDNDDGVEGAHVAYVEADDYIEFYVETDQATTYKVSARVASAVATGSFELQDEDGKNLGSVDVPNTGGWQAFETVSFYADLPKGEFTLRVLFTGPGVNLNWLDVQEDDGNRTVSGVDDEDEQDGEQEKSDDEEGSSSNTSQPQTTYTTTTSGGGAVSLGFLLLIACFRSRFVKVPRLKLHW